MVISVLQSSVIKSGTVLMVQMKNTAVVCCFFMIMLVIVGPSSRPFPCGHVIQD